MKIDDPVGALRSHFCGRDMAIGLFAKYDDAALAETTPACSTVEVWISSHASGNGAHCRSMDDSQASSCSPL